MVLLRVLFLRSYHKWDLRNRYALASTPLQVMLGIFVEKPHADDIGFYHFTSDLLFSFDLIDQFMAKLQTITVTAVIIPLPSLELGISTI